MQCFFNECTDLRAAAIAFGAFLQEHPELPVAVQANVPESECEGFVCEAGVYGYGVRRTAKFRGMAVEDRGSADDLRRQVLRIREMRYLSMAQEDALLAEQRSELDSIVDGLAWSGCEAHLQLGFQ